MVEAGELPRIFRLQSKSCVTAPLYERMFEALARIAERDPAAFDLVLDAWRERRFATFYGATLLLAASLHRAFLEADPAVAALRPAFGEGAALDDAELESRLALTLRAPSERIRAFWRSGSVQTNEVTRSVAWRIVADALPGEPTLVLAELGTSAGLNLVSADLGLAWDGFQPSRAPRVVAKLGVDRSPLDVRREADRLLLRASLWPGQVERRARLDAAIAALVADRSVTLARGELPGAVDLVEPFARRHADAFLLVFNTTFSAYLDDLAYDELRARMGALLARRRGVWVELETPRGRPAEANVAELVVWLRGERPGALDRLLVAETEPHPRTLRFVPGARDALAARLSAL